MTDRTLWISETISRRVSLVVTAVDDFTGKTILGSSVRVYIEGERPPIRKSDGFFVFIGLEEGTYIVRAEGGMYNSTECSFTTQADYVYMKMRLSPNRNYRIPMDTTCVEGKTQPDAVIKMYCTDRSAACKLLSDSSAGADSIGIYHPGLADLSGKLMVASLPDESVETLNVLVQDPKDPEAYLLAKPLQRAYPKIGTALFPVYETRADRKGNFFLAYPNAVRVKNTYRLEAEKDGSIVRKDVTLVSGERSHIDLAESD